jgi:flagellin
VVVTTANGSNAYVFIGNGNGTFGAPVAYATGGNPAGRALVDLNGDGNLDIITGSVSAISVLVGNGNGTFKARLTSAFSAFTLGSIVVGDFNGDTVKDLISVADVRNFGIALGTGTLNSTTTTTGSLSPLTGVDLSTQDSALSTVTVVDSYISDITSASGIVGAGLSRLNVAVRNLESVALDTDAAVSRIMGIDVAEETAKLVRLKILEQSGVAMLAQANLQPQIVLHLLGNQLGSENGNG